MESVTQLRFVAFMGWELSVLVCAVVQGVWGKRKSLHKKRKQNQIFFPSPPLVFGKCQFWLCCWLMQELAKMTVQWYSLAVKRWEHSTAKIFSSAESLLPDDYIVPLDWKVSKMIYLLWKTSVEVRILGDFGRLCNIPGVKRNHSVHEARFYSLLANSPVLISTMRRWVLYVHFWVFPKPVHAMGGFWKFSFRSTYKVAVGD